MPKNCVVRDRESKFAAVERNESHATWMERTSEKRGVINHFSAFPHADLDGDSARMKPREAG